MEQNSGHSEKEILAAYQLTSVDLVDFVVGEASEQVTRRVLGAALVEPFVRERLTLLGDAFTLASEAEAEFADTDDAESVSPEWTAQVENLRRQMLETARAFSGGESGLGAALPHETPGAATLRSIPAALLAKGGGLWRIAADVYEKTVAGLREEKAHVLFTGRQELTLPCLAPASAAPVAEMALRRQSFTTPDGVHIEFQQLPGKANRLRVLIDASGMSEDFAALGYNAAFVTLEEDAPAPDDSHLSAADTDEKAILYPPDRHVLIVRMNPEGRGFTDFKIAVNESGAPLVLPAPRRGCHLVSATLTRISEEMNQSKAAPPRA